MTTDTIPAPPTAPSAPATPTNTPAVPATPTRAPRRFRWPVLIAAGGAAIVATYFGVHYWTYRISHSITDDAFVEAHIVNVAPEMVRGAGASSSENKIERQEILAEIEPVHYRDGSGSRQLDSPRQVNAEASLSS